MPFAADPELELVLERSAPYLRRLLEQAAERALRLHAEDVTVEHVVGAAFEDEDCAAHAAIVHAFADPETLAHEALALSPGVMVVGSVAALPFSPRAVAALEEARAEAARDGLAEIGALEILRSAVRTFEAGPRADLESAGYGEPAPRAAAGAGEAAVEPGGPLFRFFSGPGKQLLSLANRQAHQAREASIGPAQLVLAALKEDPGLGQAVGLSHLRAREVLRGRTADLSAPAPRPIRPDAALRAFLCALPSGAGSLEVLLACHAQETAEVAALLARHKVTRALLERARGAFEDPAP